MANKVKYNNFLDKNIILKMYNNNYSVIQIAKQLGIKAQYIYRFMKYHNISLRTKSDAMKIAYNKEIKKKNKTRSVNNYTNITKELLLQLYHKDNKTIIEIAKQLNVTQIGISKLIKEYNIEKRTRTGINNPHWKNGVMFDRGRKLIYNPSHKDTNFLGKYVYEYRLIAEKKIGRALNKNEIVHHIDNNPKNNNLDNLLVLTQSQHINLHRVQGDMYGKK
jgi:transposase-like protein